LTGLRARVNLSTTETGYVVCEHEKILALQRRRQRGNSISSVERITVQLPIVINPPLPSGAGGQNTSHQYNNPRSLGQLTLLHYNVLINHKYRIPLKRSEHGIRKVYEI